MKPVILLIAAAIVLPLLSAGCTAPQGPSPGQAGGETRQVVHALLPLTGSLSAKGESARVALDLAARDMNSFSREIGSPYRVEVVIHNIGSGTENVSATVEDLGKRGEHIVIGKLSSAQLDAIRQYTDSHGILVAATSSSAPDLAIRNDSIFRYCPDDTYQGRALAYLISADRKLAIVAISRDDVWGHDLLDATNESLGESGIVTAGAVMYPAETADFTRYVDELDRLAGAAARQYGQGSVAVMAATFEEIAPVMEYAMTKNNLSSLRWYGSDGNMLLPVLEGGSSAARSAAAVNFTGAIMGVHRTGVSSKVYDELRARLGREPDAHSLAMYDLLHVVGAIRRETDATDLPSLSRAFTGISETYTGVSGECRLNLAGDRRIAVYDYWRVRDLGQASWNRVGRYTLWPDGPEFELNPAGIETPWETR